MESDSGTEYARALQTHGAFELSRAGTPLDELIVDVATPRGEQVEPAGPDGLPAVIARGFIVRGDTNQSDGMGPSYEVGRYATLEEAQKASRAKGVQGDSGTVDSFETVLSSDGTVETRTRRLIARRRTPEGSFLVGFLDFREYEYGIRPAALHPLRPAPTSMLAADRFALSEHESQGYAVLSPTEVRQELLSDARIYGLWRRAGETRWRGEFAGSSEKELDRWLPEGHTRR